MNYRGYKRWAIQCISPKEAIVNLNRLRTIHLFTLYQIIYTKYSLKFHIGRHTGEKPFSWTCCCKPFSHRYYLTRHMPSHNGEKPCSWLICNKFFSQKSDAKINVRSHRGVKPFSCLQCNKSFSHRYSLKMLNHTGEKPLPVWIVHLIIYT